MSSTTTTTEKPYRKDKRHPQGFTQTIVEDLGDEKRITEFRGLKVERDQHAYPKKENGRWKVIYWGRNFELRKSQNQNYVIITSHGRMIDFLDKYHGYAAFTSALKALDCVTETTYLKGGHRYVRLQIMRRSSSRHRRPKN